MLRELLSELTPIVLYWLLAYYVLGPLVSCVLL